MQSGGLFPLTLALSPREREPLSSARHDSLRRKHVPARPRVLPFHEPEQLAAGASPSPLPEGRGPGRGVRSFAGFMVPMRAEISVEAPHEPKWEINGPLSLSLSPSKGERVPKAGEGEGDGRLNSSCSILSRVRRTTTSNLGLLTLVLTALTGSAAAPVAEPNLRLENDAYLVEVSPTNGLVCRIRDKRGGLELLQEPRLADNFKFSLPIRRDYAWQSTEANYVLGKNQRLTRHALTGSGLSLTWGPPLVSVLGKRYDVSAVMTIALTGADIQFNFKIRNRSKLEIGEVYYPILGGSLGLGDTTEVRKSTELVLPGSANLRKASIYRTFASMSPFGVLDPEQYYTYPDNLSMPWLELDQPALKRGVYFGAHDPIARYKVVHLEMSPGLAGARPDGNWPSSAELQGAPAGVRMCFVHFPYQPARQDFDAAPVVLRVHDGDWREGAKIYGGWLESRGDLNPPRADWLYRTPAFQECEAVAFKQLPNWAKQGLAAGVKSLLLTKWNKDLKGDGVPRLEPDPQFGSREEFAQALRQCHELGVKVTVALSLPPASQLAPEWKQELQRYACRDRWGTIYSTLGGFGRSPLTGSLGDGERRAWLNPGHPGMRRLLAGQLRELASLGVDGVHLQEFFARPLDFNPAVGRTADRASWEGGLDCIREILRTCRSVRPGFSVSVDTAWDQALGLSQVSSAPGGDGCALRTAVPSWQPTLTVAGDDGVAAINNAFLRRARLCISPSDNKPVGGPATAGLVEYPKGHPRCARGPQPHFARRGLPGRGRTATLGANQLRRVPQPGQRLANRDPRQSRNQTGHVRCGGVR